MSGINERHLAIYGPTDKSQSHKRNDLALHDLIVQFVEHGQKALNLKDGRYGLILSVALEDDTIQYAALPGLVKIMVSLASGRKISRGTGIDQVAYESGPIATHIGSVQEQLGMRLIGAQLEQTDMLSGKNEVIESFVGEP